jgi:glycosyltransferase involved in cell wall biosynthesis
MSPLIIQESFSVGVPIIASKVYGNMEQIQHGINGLLFEFNNSIDLKKQILRCIHEPKLVNSMSSNIKQPRSFESVAEDYLKLYNRVLQ